MLTCLYSLSAYVDILQCATINLMRKSFSQKLDTDT